MPIAARTEPDPARPTSSGWDGWLARSGAVVAMLATLCCLGVSALVSLATAIGATFLTEDSTLQPLLGVALLLTVAGSALTWWRHRNPAPLLLTTAAAALIFWSLYGGTEAGEHHEDPDQMGGPTTWVGIALLLAAQLWDVWRLRAQRRPARRPAHDSATR